MNTDPYFPSDDEIIKREFDDFEMPAHDKRSIEEIRKKLAKKGYKELGQIKRHQEFLEDMTNRLRKILQSEKSLGEVNWQLEKQIEDIKVLYFELDRLRKEKIKKK